MGRKAESGAGDLVLCALWLVADAAAVAYIAWVACRCVRLELGWC